jgi:uncharacterized protein (TIGR03083 family)
MGMSADGDVRELLGAYALDALSADEAAEVEALLVRDPEAAAEAARLRSVAGLLALADAARPPTGLRETTMESARSRRAARDSPPLALYNRETERVLTVIETLRPDQDAVTANGLTVPDLVIHLAAVDSLIVEALGGRSGHDDAPTDIDGRTAALCATFAARPIADAWREWQRLVGLIRLHAGDVSRSVAWRGGDLTVGDLLIARAFEVWTHGDDLRRVRSEPSAPPSPESVALMSDLSVRWLPLGLELVGRARLGQSVRLELTGAGGGEWTVPLGLDAAATAEPAATVRIDVMDWCLVTAERMNASDVQVEVTGDVTVAGDLLVAAPAFSTL